MKSFCLTGQLLPALLAWSAAFHTVQEKADQALQQGNIKSAAFLYQNYLEKAPFSDQGIVNTHLATIYYRDQEHERAFKTFIDALNLATLEPTISLSKEEESVFNRALTIYLNSAGLTPEETAKKIIDQFGSCCAENPHFFHLAFLIAISHANLGDYEQFFKQFYQAYVHLPHHFLSYKAKAALHIKLFERAKTDQQREKERQWILEYAKHAVAMQPQDSSLYRMIFAFTREELKANTLSLYLNQIIKQNIVISRGDIPYYIEIALAFNLTDLAQKFLDQAKEWYQYSRVISAAQQFIDEKKGKESYGN